MEFMSISVQHIGLSLRLSFDRRLGFRLSNGRGRSSRLLSRRAIQLTVTSSIVDTYAGLDIVTEHAEQDTIALVLHRFCFHDYTGCDQVISVKHRGYAIQNMVAGFLYVVGHHVFKR